MPGQPRQGLGTSVRYELVQPDLYETLEERMALFHTGETRFSSTVNQAWCSMLRDESCFPRLTELPAHAYDYREGLRLGDWARVLESIRGFRQVRMDLVPPYMAGAEVLAEHSADWVPRRSPWEPVVEGACWCSPQILGHSTPYDPSLPKRTTRFPSG